MSFLSPANVSKEFFHYHFSSFTILRQEKSIIFKFSKHFPTIIRYDVDTTSLEQDLQNIKDHIKKRSSADHPWLECPCNKLGLQLTKDSPCPLHTKGKNVHTWGECKYHQKKELVIVSNKKLKGSRKYYLIHSSQDISPTIQKFVEWIYQELEQLKSNTN